MNLHLHIGPGHHEKILMEGLNLNEITFSHSNYHPDYTFLDQRVSSKSRSSRIYTWAKYLSWGISNRFKSLRRNNSHLNIPYLVYDQITAKNIFDVDLLWCWPQVSLATIKKVKQSGGKVIIDYPIPHIQVWQQVLLKEKNDLNLKNTHSSFSQFIQSRMLKEIELADKILVPSTFVRNSFISNGVNPDKLILNSYGIDTSFFCPHEHVQNTKLIILFVGTVEIRKGVHYLAKALTKLDSKKVELRIAGTIHADFMNTMARLGIDMSQITLLGQVSKDKIKDEMIHADVMVMPSLLEGLSLTILEGMACGTPIISTYNAGGPEVIDDGVNGFLIPPKDSEALTDKLIWCIQNKSELKEMGKKANERIKNGNRKEDYIDRVKEIIKSFN